jgi:DNA-directed RNA polymerase specialized sigma24 family protein
VELCRRYSNRPDLLNPLVRTWQKISNPQDHYNETTTTLQGRAAKGAWRVRDRLSPADIQALLNAYRDGTTSQTLAERYGFSTNTIKRLLREHGVHKRRSRVPDVGVDADGVCQ